MKTPLSILVLVMTFAAVALPSLTGCTTAGQYDAEKTAKLDRFASRVVAKALRAAIANNPAIKEDLGGYFRATGRVFLQMVTNKKFSPEYLLEQVDLVTQPWQGRLPPLAIDAKDLALEAYDLFYDSKLEADLSDARAPLHVATVISTAIDRALKDSGLAGL